MTDTTTATVSKLASVIIPVADQDRQLAFYTVVLGLEKRSDVPFTPDGGRWIEVAPQGAETPIALCPPGPDGKKGGKETGISLEIDAEISRFGDQVPAMFWFRDPEENRLMVVEAR